MSTKSIKTKKNAKLLKKPSARTLTDASVTLAQAKEMGGAFIRERDWQQFHNPKNLSMALAIEAAELMEKFRWVEGKDSFKELSVNREEIEDEAADVFFSLLSFCTSAEIDISSAFARKLVKTAKRYPVDKVKGLAEYKPAKRK